MLKTDTNKIGENIIILDKYIKDYKETSYTIFFELSKLDSYWHDKEKIVFDEKIIKEKNNNILILEQLDNILLLYKSIESKYSKYKNNGD